MASRMPASLRTDAERERWRRNKRETERNWRERNPERYAELNLRAVKAYQARQLAGPNREQFLEKRRAAQHKSYVKSMQTTKGREMRRRQSIESYHRRKEAGGPEFMAHRNRLAREAKRRRAAANAKKGAAP